MPNVPKKIAGMLDRMGSTQTRGDWCLQRGIEHLCKADDGNHMIPLIERHGLPGFYSCMPTTARCRHEAIDELKDPSNCFQSLCRIVVGQFVSGRAARVAWSKLLNVSNQDISPGSIFNVVGADVEVELLQKSVGITRTKALSILDLANKFDSGTLSDEFLTTASVEDTRKALLDVRGIGPWSADMFVVFYLEHPDVLPLGDLAVRKGLARTFSFNGSAKKGDICPKKDKDKIFGRLKCYEPYKSLVTYYMYRAVDEPKQAKRNSEASSNKESSPEALPDQSGEMKPLLTPRKRPRRSERHVVTP